MREISPPNEFRSNVVCSVGGLEADLAAFLTNCDAHKANAKLLKRLCSSLPSGAVLLPLLCVQRRTGNVLEQLTKFLANLGGIFCVAKVMSKNHLVKSLQKRRRPSRKAPGPFQAWSSALSDGLR